MPWPLDYRARVLAGCGYTGREIAAELGVSRTTLYRKAGRLGLPVGGHRPCPYIEARVVAGLKAGVRPDRLAAWVGCARSSVWAALHRLRAAGLVRHAGRGVWRVTDAWEH